ncbi:AidA/PixA family protein [Burkholderia ubonensis]|uniref:AidA/PixA family protein n=1 Tax=Burkholderia ubonensis TaxID=101571 RepID=UPI00075DD06E|nr:AidA/PixA family protein [Burkholderia ubonensis]KVC85245.1 hypothetical protein WI74_31555 [Burkholderia ubonensis]
MYKESGIDASVTEVTILVVINAEKVLASTGQRSQDYNNPVPIGHENQYLLCDDPYAPAVNQGTGDIKFVAKKFDLVSFTGTTIHNNSRFAVIVYNIEHRIGDRVLDLGAGLTHRIFMLEGAAQPDPNKPPYGLPALHRPRDFEILDTRVLGKGTEDFWVWFALYELGPDRETQNLVGYFKWDPTITTELR